MYKQTKATVKGQTCRRRVAELSVGGERSILNNTQLQSTRKIRVQWLHKKLNHDKGTLERIKKEQLNIIAFPLISESGLKTTLVNSTNMKQTRE